MMKVQVKYKHHYERKLVEIPIRIAINPGDDFWWSTNININHILSKTPLDLGDVIVKTYRVERHPVATTASVVIDDVKYSATSRCHPNDQFSKAKGRYLACSYLHWKLLQSGFDVTALNHFELEVTKLPQEQNKMINRVIRQYNNDDELVYTFTLKWFDLPTVESLFGVDSDNPMYDVYPIDKPELVEYFKKEYHFHCDKPEYEYFLDAETKSPEQVEFERKTMQMLQHSQFGIVGAALGGIRSTKDVSKLATLGELIPDVHMTDDEIAKFLEEEGLDSDN